LIKFGLIGCGKISKFHADAITALDHKIVGVTARPGSKNIESFSKNYRISHTYYDTKEMVRVQKPDALIVAVSWDQTENIIRDIISTGIPCLIEKPIALNTDKLQEIMKGTQSLHEGVMVGYNRRFYDFIPIIQQALKENELVSIELNFPEVIETLIKSKSPKVAKHILIYMSSHWLDLLRFLIGEVKVAWMKKKVNKQEGYVEAYNGILESIKYEVPIHLQANFNAPSNTSMTFNFRDSIYRLSPMEILTVYKGIEIIEPDHENPMRRYVPKVENTFYADATYKPGFLNQMKHFVDVFVQKTKPNTVGCTLEDALSVTGLCEQIQYN